LRFRDFAFEIKDNAGDVHNRGISNEQNEPALMAIVILIGIVMLAQNPPEAKLRRLNR
jgi:hypothetical protein